MRWLGFAALAAVSAAAGNAATPSFDCAKAATPVEKLICSDSGLATADSQLAAVFGKLIADNAAYSDSLRTGQRAWMKNRSICLNDKSRGKQISCLREQYRLRQAAFGEGTFIVCAKPSLKGAAFTMTCIAPNTPENLALTVAGNKADLAELKELKISGKGLAPQSIKLNGQYYFENLPDSLLQLLDVNFDGHPDLKVAVSTSAGPNSEFAWWLFDPKVRRFVSSPIGEQLSGFDVWADPKEKTVSVNARGSCCDWGVSTYVWKAGVLKRVKSTDVGMFSAFGLPGMDNFEHMICGEKTSHFNDAGEITSIDLELDAPAESQCEKEDVAAQPMVLNILKRAPKGYRLAVKNPLNFSILFDKPRKPQE